MTVRDQVEPLHEVGLGAQAVPARLAQRAVDGDDEEEGDPYYRELEVRALLIEAARVDAVPASGACGLAWTAWAGGTWTDMVPIRPKRRRIADHRDLGAALSAVPSLRSIRVPSSRHRRPAVSSRGGQECGSRLPGAHDLPGIRQNRRPILKQRNWDVEGARLAEIRRPAGLPVPQRPGPR